VRPEFKPEQEVRFAVVMYGGVSLAIYINGVAQELFRLVRATAPANMYAQSADLSLKDKAFYADEKLDDTERVYRRLGQMLGLDATAPGGDAIRTRFVVDIISGTSAGGINGVLLGLALAQQKDFRLSADLWRNVADIDVLLREKKSFDGLPPATPQDSESLLNGYRLYFKARDAMDDMPAESPGEPWRPAFVEQLDLAVTATDLEGVALPVRLTEHRSIDERVHRKVFRFSYGTAATTGETHSDFEGLDLMLGFAARATSSFPFAFEPVLLRDLATLTREGKAHDPPVPTERFFSDDLRRHRNPEALAFADGGYLDNKPFSYATDALRTRRADVPVSRKLIYIEPHPLKEGATRPEPTDKRGEPRDRPDVIANIAASMTLPRHETIREDVAAVAQRNVVIQRLQELGLQAERALDSLDPLKELRGPGAPLPDNEADAAVGAAGPAHAAYRTLRVRAVLDDLATLGAQLRGAQPGDDEPEAERDIEREIRNSLRAWIEGQPANRHGAFLARFDASYQQRRLSFLHDRINDLLRGGGRAARMVAVANALEIVGAPPIAEPAAVLNAARDVDLPADVAAALGDQAVRLRLLKQALNIAVDGLRHAERAPQATVLENVLTDTTERARFAELVVAAHALPEGYVAYMAKLEAFLEQPLKDADTKIKHAIRDGVVNDDKIELPPWLRTLLATYDDRFEAYDMVVLPLAYPSLGETNAVDIVRISPLDATAITPTDETIQNDPPRKLGGIRVGHFGGFLDGAWRDNDLMWGRLDAAEVIIDTLVGKDHPKRDELRVEAQAAILRQDLRDPARKAFVGHLDGKPLESVPDATLVDEFRHWFKEPAQLETSKVDDLTARSVRIGSRVFSDAAYGRKWPTLPLQAASMAGPAVARLALPASRGWRRVKAAPKAIAERVKKLWPFGG
jgi:patatin-related protein